MKLNDVQRTLLIQCIIYAFCIFVACKCSGQSNIKQQSIIETTTETVVVSELENPVFKTCKGSRIIIETSVSTKGSVKATKLVYSHIAPSARYEGKQIILAPKNNYRNVVNKTGARIKTVVYIPEHMTVKKG